MFTWEKIPNNPVIFYDRSPNWPWTSFSLLFSIFLSLLSLFLSFSSKKEELLINILYLDSLAWPKVTMTTRIGAVRTLKQLKKAYKYVGLYTRGKQKAQGVGGQVELLKYSNVWIFSPNVCGNWKKPSLLKNQKFAQGNLEQLLRKIPFPGIKFTFSN